MDFLFHLTNSPLVKKFLCLSLNLPDTARALSLSLPQLNRRHGCAAAIVENETDETGSAS
jgi:hypothetical protein